MKNSLAFALVSILATCGGGVALLGAQERKDVPTVAVVYPNFTYKSESCTFTADTFRNMRAYVFSAHGVIGSGTLRNGKYERKWTPGAGSMSAEFSEVQKPAAVGVSAAVVSYFWEWVGGSSSQSDVVQVFSCRHGHPVVDQQISNDAHGGHAGTHFDPQSGVLTVKSVRYGGGAHCCPEKLDIVTFRWSGVHFEQAGWKTVPMPK